MSIGDPFKILGINNDASPAEIRKAYRLLAKKYHPDTNKDQAAAQQFLMIQEAYEQICNGANEIDNSIKQKEQQTEDQYQKDLEAYRQKRNAAREKLRQKKQREEAYKLAYLERLKTGNIGRWHQLVAYLGLIMFFILWLDFFLKPRTQALVVESYGIKTYGSIDNHTVQLIKCTDGRYFWCADIHGHQIATSQSLKAIQTPWLHQVKALSFHRDTLLHTTPVHFSFYWAQIWLSLLLIIPIISWYFASADIIFVLGSYVSRYFIFSLILWFLFTENRIVHLFTFGQL